MRFLAELLFWVGRWDIVLGILVVVHSLIAWRWQHAPVKVGLSIGWFLVFLIGSLATKDYGPGVLDRILDSNGYDYAHLYGRIWADEEALSAMLLRWKSVLLPAYLAWLSVWMIGLVSIAVSGHIVQFVLKHMTGLRLFDHSHRRK